MIFLVISALMTDRCVVNALNERPKVIVVAFGTTQPSGVASLSFISPPYEMAVQELVARYSDQIEFSYFLSPARACLAAADNPDTVLAKWYYNYQEQSPGSVTVFTTGLEVSCAADDLSVFSLISNWNKITLNTLSGTDVNKDLPTLLGFSVVCSACFVTFASNLIDHYDWQSVFVMVDRNALAVYIYVGNGLAARLQRAGRRVVTVHQIATNSNDSFVDNLRHFNNVSRVLFFFGHAPKLRQLLIYIAIEAIPYAVYGNMTWQYGDANDEVAKGAFNSLLVLQPYHTTLLTNNLSVHLQQEFRNRSATKFNNRYTADSGLLQYLMSSYTAILILGQVLIEALLEHQNLSDARGLMRRFLNRTFATDFGPLYLDSNGIRVDDIAITHYNTNRSMREPFLVQYAGGPIGDLENVGAVNGWPGPNPFPPPGEPFCGFRNEKDECKDTTKTDRVLYGVCGGCLGLIACCALVAVRVHVAHQRQMNLTPWWLIRPEEGLLATSRTPRPVRARRLTRCDAHCDDSLTENKTVVYMYRAMQNG